MKPSIEDNVYDIILKAQCKAVPALLPQQRPKTAASRSKTLVGKKTKAGMDELRTPIRGAEALRGIQISKEESKMKEKILQAQLI